MNLKNNITKTLAALTMVTAWFAFISFKQATSAVSFKPITQKEFDDANALTSKFYSDHKHFYVEVTHATYKGHEAQVPYDQSAGYFYRDNDSYHSFFFGIHTIQNDKYKVTVDTLSKTISVADPTPSSEQDLMQTNYDNAHTYITSYEEAITDKGNLYRVKFNDVPAYSSYTMLQTDEGQLLEVTIYYRKAIAEDARDTASKKIKPKLSISYSGFNAKAVFDVKKEFDTSKYFTVTANKLVATTKYLTFKILDKRISQLK